MFKLSKTVTAQMFG